MDGRVELDLLDDVSTRGRIRSAAVALVEAFRVEPRGDGSVHITAPSLQETRGVCGDVRFAEQPAAAFCSGTLIDDDLVLTAGHCIREATCASTRFVFGYTVDATESLPINHVYSCRAVLVRRDDDDRSENRFDYAIVQLDRSAAPHQHPLSTGEPTSVSPGAELTLFGFPDGVPLKVDTGGAVITTRRALDYFTTTVDAFSGNSGSGVLARGRVVGMLARGGRDYEQDPICGGCLRPRVLDDATEHARGEAVSYAQPAVDALCDLRWPSRRLCGLDPVCGDGFCTAGETPECGDCDFRGCGDGVCDLQELRTCPRDCDAERSAPDGWRCGGGFDAGDGCDCACGLYDPDCSRDAPVRGCGAGQTCSPAGACVREAGGEAPPEWTCAASHFDADDGCDCECGAGDPDCDDLSQLVFNCGPGVACGPSGRCSGAEVRLPDGWTCGALAYSDASCDCRCGAEDRACQPEECSAPPSGWSCGAQYWDDGACDCGCGAPDIDCDEQTRDAPYGCDWPSWVCTDAGECEAPEHEISGWTCRTELYASGDGCNCGCGLWDPDCDAPDSTPSDCSLDGVLCAVCQADATCTTEGCLPSPF